MYTDPDGHRQVWVRDLVADKYAIANYDLKSKKILIKSRTGSGKIQFSLNGSVKDGKFFVDEDNFYDITGAQKPSTVHVLESRPSYTNPNKRVPTNVVVKEESSDTKSNEFLLAAQISAGMMYCKYQDYINNSKTNIGNWAMAVKDASQNPEDALLSLASSVLNNGMDIVQVGSSFVSGDPDSTYLYHERFRLSINRDIESNVSNPNTYQSWLIFADAGQIAYGAKDLYKYFKGGIRFPNFRPDLEVAGTGMSSRDLGLDSADNILYATKRGTGVSEVTEGIAENVNWKGFDGARSPKNPKLTKLQEHYQNHGPEFGDITQNQYLKMSKEFAKESNSAFQETQVGNFVIKYDPATRRTLIGNTKTREIKTFYKADFRADDPFRAAIGTAKEIGGNK